MKKKDFALILFLIFLFLFFKIEAWVSNHHPSLQAKEELIFLRHWTQSLQNIQAQFPIWFALGFSMAFLVSTLLFLPFTGSFFSIFAGACFGLKLGIFLFSFLVSIAYTASFLVSRKFLMPFFNNKKEGKIKKVIKLAQKSESPAWTLFALRISGTIPAFVVNAAMGATSLKTMPYYFITQLGTFPHVVIGIYTGHVLSQIQSLDDVVSPQVFGVLLIIAIGSLLIKSVLKKNQI